MLDILQRNVTKRCRIFENVIYTEKNVTFGIILHHWWEFLHHNFATLTDYRKKGRRPMLHTSKKN
jgi:hypothetical protein